MHKAIEHIHEHAQVLRDTHVASDELGLLAEPARAVLERSGGMRLLQAKSHGGFEASPTDFLAWVRAAAQHNPSAGWVAGVVGKNDPYQQEALAEVESDLAAGIAHIDLMLMQWMDQLHGAPNAQPISKAQRLEFRRNQVRAVQRVLFGIDKLMARAGSAAIWSTRPLERYWRDLRTAGTHICDTPDVVYRAWADHEFKTGIQHFLLH